MKNPFLKLTLTLLYCASTLACHPGEILYLEGLLKDDVEQIHQSLQETEDFSLIRNAGNNLASNLNSIRQCQQNLNQSLISCDQTIQLHLKSFDKFFHHVKDVRLLTTSNEGLCEFNPLVRENEIINDQDQTLLYSSVENYWVSTNEQRCQLDDGNPNAFSIRNIVFTHNTLTIVDFVEHRDFNFRTSQNLGVRITMPHSTSLNFRQENQNLVIEWSSGEKVILEKTHGYLIGSSFLKEEHFSDETCFTKIRRGSWSSPQNLRFIPLIELQDEYRNNNPDTQIQSTL